MHVYDIRLFIASMLCVFGYTFISVSIFMRPWENILPHGLYNITSPFVLLSTEAYKYFHFSTSEESTIYVWSAISTSLIRGWSSESCKVLLIAFCSKRVTCNVTLHFHCKKLAYCKKGRQRKSSEIILHKARWSIVCHIWKKIC